ncbi:MAG TPA: MFS transporter [Woeseiaceae bacterium]|nr:MFS transporter [Woeseiaceae bacterium]
MKSALAPVAALLIGVAILLTGQGLQGTFLPVRAAIESFPTLAIGIMGAAYFSGFTVGCLRGGNLVCRVGHVRVFLAMTALASAIPLMHGLILHPIAWGALRFATGYCFAVLYIVIESWLNDSSTVENRGIVFSTYTMITLTVMAAGQMMTLLYDPTGLQLFILASILVSLGAIPVALSTSPTPEQPHTVKPNLKRLFEISPSGTLGCLTSGLANGAFWALAAVFTVGIKGDTSWAAWFMTATVIGGALSQWPIGYLSDRIGRRKVLLATALFGAGIAATMVYSFNELTLLRVNLLGAAWGAVAFPLYTLAVANANDYAETDEYVMVSSGLLLMYGLGAIVGPFIAAGLMTLGNPAGLFVFTGVIHLLLALYLVQRISRRESPSAEHHIEFRDALTAVATVSQVYEEEIRQSSDNDEA